MNETLFDDRRPTTSKHVEALLRAHYLPETKPASGLFATELQDPTGMRRADVIWAPMTTVDRGKLIGHEIKVSRSDVITELSDPTKSDAWLRYCSKFWLVVADRSLVAGLDIPDGWGIMAPPSGRLRRSMTIVKPAPLLKPIDPAPALAALTAWMFYRYSEQANELARAESRAIGAESRSTRAEEEAESLRQEISLGDRSAYYYVARLVDQLRALDNNPDGYWRSAPPPETIAEVIRDLSAARQLAKELDQDIASRIRGLDDVLEPGRRLQALLRDYQQNNKTTALAAAQKGEQP